MFKGLLIYLIAACGLSYSQSAGLIVESRDEQLSNSAQTGFRVRLTNNGSENLNDVRFSYYVSHDPAKTVLADNYWADGVSISIDSVSPGESRIDFNVRTLPVGTTPNSDGYSFGIHYSGWSTWDKENDYSQPLSSSFQVTNKIPVYVGGILFTGIEPGSIDGAPIGLRIDGLQPEAYENDPSWIQISNAGSTPVNLLQARLVEPNGREFSPGNVVLPVGATLKIEVGSEASCNDLDFSDLAGCMVGANLVLNATGEAYLTFAQDSISYLAWGAAGSSVSDAVRLNLWNNRNDFLLTANDIVGPTKRYAPGTMFILPKYSEGKNSVSWLLYHFAEKEFAEQGILPFPEPISLSNGSEVVVEPTENTNFAWTPIEGAKAYQLNVIRKSDAAYVIERVTTQTTFDTILDADTYIWYVVATDLDSAVAGGLWTKVKRATSKAVSHVVNTADAVVANVASISPGLNVLIVIVADLIYPDSKSLNVVAKAARRDTKLLDVKWGSHILGLQVNKVSGGPQARNWDESHVDMKETDDEESWRCWAVSTNMLNTYFGGNLTQDEIKMHVKMSSADPVFSAFPHDKDGGGSTGNINNVLEWALKAPVTFVPLLTLPPTNLLSDYIYYAYGKPFETDIKVAIASGFPLYVWQNSHIMLIDAYRTNANGKLEIRLLNTDNNGTSQWRKYGGESFVVWWYPHITGSVRNRDSRIDLDSDNDGMQDYDEIVRFKTDPNNADSDHDGISDKTEVMAYTLKEVISNPSCPKCGLTSEPFADADNDGKRGELDPDADNGGVLDGNEDRNKNGKLDANESDPYEATDDYLNSTVGLTIPHGWAIYALGQLKLNDGMKCYGNVTASTLCDVASGSTVDQYSMALGAFAKVGRIYSRGGVLLRNYSTVNSDVVANGYVSRQSRSVVLGTIYDKSSLLSWFGSIPKLPSFPLDYDLLGYSLSTTTITVHKGETFILVDGTNYASVKVENGGVLVLPTGEIFLGSIQLESGSKISILNPGTQTILHLNGSCIWRASFTNTDLASVARGFSVVQHSNFSMNIEGAWAGTLIAPQSSVIMGQSRKIIYGRVLGNSVEVHQYSNFYKVDLSEAL